MSKKRSGCCIRIFLKVLPKEARQGGNGARLGETSIRKEESMRYLIPPLFPPFFAPIKCLAFNALGPTPCKLKLLYSALSSQRIDQ